MTAPVPSSGLPPAAAGHTSADSLLATWAESSAAISPIRRVAVVGLGLIGGSLARDLATASEFVLIGWDADARTRCQAQAAGIPVADTLAECVAGEPDMVVLAVPLAAMADVCRELSPLVGGRTLVTDVGSVKAPVREVMEAQGLAQRYLGSHPMAGTEASGFTAAVDGLFREAAWVLTVDEASAPRVDGIQVLAVAELVIRALGCRVYVLTDEQHDEAVALVSHLPHVFAAALLGEVSRSPVRDAALSLAAGSFRDGTRVAGTNPARTEAMVTGNAAWVVPLVEQAAARLQSLATQLRSGADVSAFFAPEDPAADLPVPSDEASTVACGVTSVSGTGSASDAAFVTHATCATNTLDAADLDWPALRRFLLDATVAGRAIRAVDLDTRTLTLASQAS